MHTLHILKHVEYITLSSFDKFRGLMKINDKYLRGRFLYGILRWKTVSSNVKCINAYKRFTDLLISYAWREKKRFDDIEKETFWKELIKVRCDFAINCLLSFSTPVCYVVRITIEWHTSYKDGYRITSMINESFFYRKYNFFKL